jgi:hypothetical protein
MTISNCTSSKSEAELRSLAWWCMPVIPALRRWRQEGLQFQARIGFTARPYLNNKDEKTSPQGSHRDWIKAI